MKAYVTSRFVPVLVLVVLAALGTAGAAMSASPSDAGAPALPNCMTGVDIGRICKVSPALASFTGRPVSWQAKTGTWIVIRLGWIDPDPANCAATEATLVLTITLDGQQLPVDTFPCQFDTGFAGWIVDYRTLVHPLPPGDHAITVTSYFPVAIGYPGDYISAGTVETDSTTLTVVP